jgi:hypothetical protein
MNRGTEVRLIQGQALLEELDASLVVLFLLIDHCKVEVRVEIRHREKKSRLIESNRFLNLPRLLKASAKSDNGIRVLVVNLMSPSKNFASSFQLCTVFYQNLAVFCKNFAVVWLKVHSRAQFSQPFLFLVLSDEAPA